MYSFIYSFFACFCIGLQIPFLLHYQNTSLTVQNKDWRTRSIYQVMTDRFYNPQSRAPCSNLYSYCGGTFKGIESQLDYIEMLGFNAIWISPIVENTKDGYHGYWSKDLYSISKEYGGKSDLKDLIKACHKRNIWVMVDVVANHMGPTLDSFGNYYPFSKQSHYHSYCTIKNYNNQREVEFCRIGSDQSSLPDLNTENEEVIRELNNWIQWVVREFDMDGVRVDTVKHVRKDFWNGFCSAAGVFCIGEVLHGEYLFLFFIFSPAYVGPYQRHMQSLLNFPLYFTIRDVFQSQQSMWALEIRHDQMQQYFSDISVLGNFVDNHDFKRFMNQQRDRVLLMNALVYVFFSVGIPIIWQGTEFLMNGGDDPHNRVPLFNYLPEPGKSQKLNNENIIEFISKCNHARKKAVEKYPNFLHDQKHIWTNDDLFVFLRSEVLIVTSNVGNGKSFNRMIKIPFKRRNLF